MNYLQLIMLKQEKMSVDENVRWTDRICMDGTFEANLFHFYRRVYPKLSSVLPKPFRLENGVRLEFSTYTLTVSDRLSKPNAWDLASLDYYFGEYGEKKHELMMKWTEESWDDEYINSLFADIYGFGTLSPKDPNYIEWLAGWFAEQLEQENVERLQNKLDVWKESDTGKPVDFTPKEWGR